MSHLDLLHGKMAEDSEILIRAEKWGGAGSLKGHLTQYPPPMAPYVFRDIVANPFVIQVTKRLLPTGPKAHLGKMFNSYYNANANCPGSLQQALHMDWPHLWPGLEQGAPALLPRDQHLPRGRDGGERRHRDLARIASEHEAHRRRERRRATPHRAADSRGGREGQPHDSRQPSSGTAA